MSLTIGVVIDACAMGSALDALAIQVDGHLARNARPLIGTAATFSAIYSK